MTGWDAKIPRCVGRSRDFCRWIFRVDGLVFGWGLDGGDEAGAIAIFPTHGTLGVVPGDDADDACG